MNTHIVALYVTAQMAMQDLSARLESEEGQTSVEWLGIAAVVAVVIGILLTQGTQFGNKIANAIKSIIDSVANGAI